MINPSVIFIGTVGFLVSFILHVITWRRFRPVKHLLCLAAIFIFLPIGGYLLLYQSLGIFNLILVIIWHLGFSLTYIMTYPTIQAECPTFKILLAVRDSMPVGLSEESIKNIFSENKLLSDRVEDLIAEGLLHLKQGSWLLSFKGRLLAAGFSVYRRLLGLPLGEG